MLPRTNIGNIWIEMLLNPTSSEKGIEKWTSPNFTWLNTSKRSLQYIPYWIISKPSLLSSSINLRHIITTRRWSLKARTQERVRLRSAESVITELIYQLIILRRTRSRKYPGDLPGAGSRRRGTWLIKKTCGLAKPSITVRNHVLSVISSITSKLRGPVR